MIRQVFFAAAMVVSASALSPCAQAAAEPGKTIDLPAIHNMVAGLGFEELKSDNPANIQFDASKSSRSYRILIYTPDDGKFALVCAFLSTVSKDDMQKAPVADMLQFEWSHLNYLSAVKTGDGSFDLYLVSPIPASAVTPIKLRETIDDLLYRADESTDLWTAAKWKGAAPTH